MGRINEGDTDWNGWLALSRVNALRGEALINNCTRVRRLDPKEKWKSSNVDESEGSCVYSPYLG